MDHAPGWRILIANVTLASHTGTETVVRDLALGLLAAGQKPMVYSRLLGDIAQEIRASGIPVVSQLEDLPDPPDIVHGHHHVETVEASLSDAECAQVALKIEKCPDEAVCQDAVHVDVDLENGSSRTLGSFPPCPIQFSYRWLKDGTAEVVVAEGVRTVIRRALPPGQHAAYAVTGVAPDEPGRYRLRVTLVQEWVRWLDLLERPISADSVVSVAAADSPFRPA